MKAAKIRFHSTAISW